MMLSSAPAALTATSMSLCPVRAYHLWLQRRVADQRYRGPVTTSDVQGRLEILKHYAARLVVDPKLDLKLIARGTPGLSGADLENLANLAAIRASKEGDTAVRLSHMDWARDRLLMGAERRSRFVSEESLRLSAYIEAGRALIANLTDGSVPLHKVSVPLLARSVAFSPR
jgi:ATP-dependent Zn protease